MGIEGISVMMRVALGTIIGGLVVAPLTFWIVDREPPIYRYDGKMTPNLVQGGDWVTIEWNIRAVRNCEEWPPNRGVTRVIIDSTGKLHDMEPTTAIAGKAESSKEEIKRRVRLPMGMTDGPARYRSVACFKCNWTQRWLPVCVSSPEIPFTVLPREGL
jgi:hypothetical protein